ncbi:hypothetical protein EWF20_07575 [Sulfolobus sp. S-194]|uniref:hypothetical protein n=1 Tax=Sulfolobus sp. S-194 TaxID=2512240 RepID=UPI001436E306|nr:hypothetical protein [Sulfolobus sp. S-194]QIW24022.1 hypothetical protein EWF20_07575 [Sulfolobus sp. S-194]
MPPSSELLLLIGAFVGLVLFIIYMLIVSKSDLLAGNIQIRNYKVSIRQILQLIFILIISIFSMFAILQKPSNVYILSSISNIYLETEFAILVVLVLAYVLAEKAVRDEYRQVLLLLTIVTVLSMLLLVPWVIR